MIKNILFFDQFHTSILRYLISFFIIFLYLLFNFWNMTTFFSPFRFSWNLFSHRKKKFLCGTCSINPVTSSARDAILLYASGMVERSLIALSSLRAVNSRCTIVVLHPNEPPLPPAYINFCQQLNIILSNYSIPKKIEPLPFLSRFLFYSNWSESHISDYDRIFHVDSFDTYFQGDIFTDDITSYALHATIEGREIDGEPYNPSWIKQCYGSKIYEMVKKQKILCSGTFGGPSNIFSEIVNQMIHSPNFWKQNCLLPSLDQAHYIYLIWSNYFRNISIPIIFHGCDSGLITASYCDQFIIDNSTGYTYSKRFYKSPPKMIHQYDRDHRLSNWVNCTQCKRLLPIRSDVYITRRDPGIFLPLRKP